MKNKIIGISGPSVCGKSTLCKEICKVNPKIIFVKMDDFYIDAKKFPKFKHWSNCELPENIKFDLLYDTLHKLKSGESTTIPKYSKRSGIQIGTQIVKPAPIILVEGFLLFLKKEIRQLLDIKVLIDIRSNIQLKRRKQRQPELDEEYFHEVIVPTYNQYHWTFQNQADFVLDGRKSVEELKKELVKIITAKQNFSKF